MNRRMKIRFVPVAVVNESLSKLFVFGSMKSFPSARKEPVDVFGGGDSMKMNDLSEDRLHDRHFLDRGGECLWPASFRRTMVGPKLHPSTRRKCERFDPRGAKTRERSSERVRRRFRGFESASKGLGHTQNFPNEDGVMVTQMGKFMGQNRFQFINAPNVQTGKSDDQYRTAVVRMDGMFDDAAGRQMRQTDFRWKTTPDLVTQSFKNLEQTWCVGLRQNRSERRIGLDGIYFVDKVRHRRFIDGRKSEAIEKTIRCSISREQ